MRSLTLFSSITAVMGLSAVVLGQGGFGGGGGGGYGGGGIGGNFGVFAGGRTAQNNYEAKVQEIEAQISSYLNGEEVKNILTPGEHCDWSLDLKVGQVVIAEARSEAFDPALEVVDAKEKVLASNDDRFPGDQRPLLLWRCEQDGAYTLRARCFRNKSGGQFSLRFVIYDSIDLGTDKPTEKTFEAPTKFLMRIPMKAGQIKQIIVEDPDWQKYTTPQLGQTISPLGLPDIGLAKPLNSAIGEAIVAPVDGDYYVFAYTYEASRRTVRVRCNEVQPSSPRKEGDGYSALAPTGAPVIWSIPVKAGEILEASTSGVGLQSDLAVAEQPDFPSFSVKKPETNPFFPKATGKAPAAGPAFTELPARARDPRIKVFMVERDANLWLATNGGGEPKKQFSFSVRSAAKNYVEGKNSGAKLTIGNTEYWTFDAKVGEVMTFKSTASAFAEKIVVRDPDLGNVKSDEATPDQTKLEWDMVVQKPGRYLVAVSAIGDGGGGEYGLERHTFPPRVFGKGLPARGELANGETQVWEFTAKPDEPLFMHWQSPSSGYSVMIRDDKGADAWLGLTGIDAHNSYGVLKVDKPKTFMIVLSGLSDKAEFLIELGDIPGYKAEPSKKQVKAR